MMNHSIKGFQTHIENAINDIDLRGKPIGLYEPIKYVMDLGGKRLRPLLGLIGYTLFKEDYKRIINPVLAVELFHNFTLVHDDIMDEAPLRRGQKTVHKKWSHNKAILSGDVMLIKSYQLLTEVESKLLPRVLDRFNTSAIEVCAGQEYDMEFESMTEVTEDQYLEMIRLKTAVLLGFSLELGGILANQNERITNKLFSFGTNIGVGFQIKDDFLDVYADTSKFGKQNGGDIIANKKTFLLIEALKNANKKQHKALVDWLKCKVFDKEEKVRSVKNLYNEIGVKGIATDRMNCYFERAFQNLNEIDCEDDRKEDLRSFAKYLIDREH